MQRRLCIEFLTQKSCEPMPPKKAKGDKPPPSKSEEKKTKPTKRKKPEPGPEGDEPVPEIDINSPELLELIAKAEAKVGPVFSEGVEVLNKRRELIKLWKQQLAGIKPGTFNYNKKKQAINNGFAKMHEWIRKIKEALPAADDRPFEIDALGNKVYKKLSQGKQARVKKPEGSDDEDVAEKISELEDTAMDLRKKILLNQALNHNLTHMIADASRKKDDWLKYMSNDVNLEKAPDYAEFKAFLEQTAQPPDSSSSSSASSSFSPFGTSSHLQELMEAADDAAQAQREVLRADALVKREEEKRDRLKAAKLQSRAANLQSLQQFRKEQKALEPQRELAAKERLDAEAAAQQYHQDYMERLGLAEQASSRLNSAPFPFFENFWPYTSQQDDLLAANAFISPLETIEQRKERLAAEKERLAAEKARLAAEAEAVRTAEAARKQAADLAAELAKNQAAEQKKIVDEQNRLYEEKLRKEYEKQQKNELMRQRQQELREQNDARVQIAIEKIEAALKKERRKNPALGKVSFDEGSRLAAAHGQPLTQKEYDSALQEIAKYKF